MYSPIEDRSDHHARRAELSEQMRRLRSLRNSDASDEDVSRATISFQASLRDLLSEAHFAD